MMKEGMHGFIFDEKPVFDWKGDQLGVIKQLRRDPKTRAARELVVNLTPEAKQSIGTPEDDLQIPISYVFGIRKDAVSLNRSTWELKHAEPLQNILRG